MKIKPFIIDVLARSVVLVLVLSSSSIAALAETPLQRTIGNPVGPTDQEVKTWSFPASTIRTLKLTNNSGDMLLRRSEGTEVRIKAIKHNASRRDFDEVVVDLQQQDDRLVGKVRYLAEVSTVAVSFTVELPPGVSVELRSSSGNITLNDIDGEVHAATGSGHIQAEYTLPLPQTELDMHFSQDR